MNPKHLIHDKAILNRQPESQDLLAGVDGVESPVEHERSEIYGQLKIRAGWNKSRGWIKSAGSNYFSF